MKPQHAGSNYKWLFPFFRKMERTGQTTFKAGLGLSRLIFEDQGYSMNEYGHAWRIRYENNPDKYFEIAISDETRTATPLRYIDRNAVSLVNKVPDLTEINCFWFSWKNPVPRPDDMRKVDTLLYEWIDKLTHREYYNAKYA